MNKNAFRTGSTVASAIVVLLEAAICMVWVVMWTAGVVIAKGFWSTAFAITTGGFWSLYLITERVLLHYGIV